MIANVVAELHRRRARRATGTSASSSTRWRRSTAPASPPRSSPGSTARRSSPSSSTTRSTPTPSARREIEGLQEGLMRDLERFVVLQVVDVRWREHLESMDYMREGIHLRGDGPEGPARRVPQRGPRHVPGAEPGDPRGGVALLFHAPGRGRRPVDGRRRRCRRPQSGNGGGALSYEHETLAGAEAIAAAGGTAERGRRRRRQRRRPPPQPVVKSAQRERRPQRPLLVRLGQEVQALPRRLSPPAPLASILGDGRPGRPARRAARGDQGPAWLGP